jgi:hypothetical protein
MKSMIPALLSLVMSTTLFAQTISIQPRAALVMKGSVHLVLSDASLVNNGILTDSQSSIKFIGHKDTSFSYLSGTQTTSIYNLSVDKTNFGTVLRSTVYVRNVLGVYGGILYPDSNLILKSDSNLTARVDVIPATANITGKSIVERYYPNRRSWRLVTAPLTATTSIFDCWQNKGIYEAGINTLVSGPNPTGAAGNGLDPSPQNNASMKTWNYSTQVLEPVLNTKAPLSPGNSGSADNVGYFLFVRGDRDVNNFYIPNSNNTTLRSNGQLQTGTQTFIISTTAGGYTLIGNPFASPVDFNAVTRNNLVKRFYVWDPALNIVGGYVMLDDLDNDGVFTKSINSSAQNNHLQSSQAFFVQTLNNGAASISFLETCKSAGNNNALFRPSSPVSTQSIRISLNKKQQDGSLLFTDAVLLECNESYKDSVDTDDALKFTNINECLGLVRYGTLLTAERRPTLKANDTLFLKMSRTTQSNYQFSIDPSGIANALLTAWLEDSYLQSSIPIDLLQTTTIDFAIDGNTASAASNRFRIVFKQTQVLPVTFVSVNAYQQDQFISVNWKVANELNMIKYDIERSVNGNEFIKIGSVSVTGNNNTQNQYQYLDEHPADGNNFYRIKLYDATRAIKYSAMVNVVMTNKKNGISIYPNPVTGNTIHIQLSNQPVGNYHFKITNTAGQVLYEGNTQNNSANNSIVITPKTLLPASTYQLEITAAENKMSKQIIVAQ